MTPAVPVTTDIVLVGGGHAHIEVVRRFAMAPEPGVRLTLIARDIDTPYSGMVPGYFAGHYTREECHIDLRPLVQRAGARLYHSSATGIDPAARQIFCDNRPPVTFDLASIDIGSAPDVAAIPGAIDRAIPVKPIDGLLAAVEEIEDDLLAARAPMRIVVVGAGAGGVELALALNHRFTKLLRDRGIDPSGFSMTVIDAAPTPLPALAHGARRALTQAMATRSIELALGSPVTEIAPDRVLREDAPAVPFDRAIMVTGAGAPPWIGACGLATDDRGFLAVDRHLRSRSHPFVFAAGDIASFGPRGLPKSGVYAVRAGPVLADNLRRAATGRTLSTFRPQRHTLALVATGPKHAVAARGPLALSGRALWRLKDRIDRRFMEKYADLPRMRALPPGGDVLDDMRCGGCGAKIDRAVLARALARIDLPASAHVLAGLDAPDDAAILRPPEVGEVVVQSVDQFRAFIDDPYLFGRIAANHCLGDLHAMGAAPVAALALVMMPHGMPAKQEDDLAALLAGAARSLSEVGAVLAGGHTGEGAELAFGLSVTGHGRPDALTRRGGLRAGDVLIVTKALGSGVILNADMNGRARGKWLSAALDAMVRSCAVDAQILRAHGASAAVDVTGFGLAGHLTEMLDASGVDAELDLAAFPVLDGTLDLLGEGVESTLAPANRAAALGAVTPGSTSRHGILFDPQTAGGLLAGVPEGKVDACIARLRDAGATDATAIGRVTPRAGPSSWIELA